MPASEDLLIGKLALQLKFVTPEQVEECVHLQSESPQPRKIGELLQERGYLSEEQLRIVVALQNRNLQASDPLQGRSRAGLLFGKIVVREKLATVDQVNECLRLQASPAGRGRNLGEILVEKGYLTSEQVRRILSQQLKKIMRCEPCGLSFTVYTGTAGRNVPCPKCKRVLLDTRSADEVRTDAEFVTGAIPVLPPPETPEPLRTPIRTKCVVCDNIFQAPPDASGRVRCTTCNSTFTPRA